MKFNYEIFMDRGQPYARVTGAEDPAANIRIPDVLEGLPVKSVGSGAFRGLSGVRSVIIPEGVEEIGSFAFYGMPDLSAISFPKTLLGIGLGAVRSLPMLREVTVSFPASGRATLLRDILGDTDAAMSAHICYEEGEAELYFPKYVYGYDEDTHARAFHSFMEGSGYAYRETLERKGINYSGYDLIFHRAVNDGAWTAAHVALARLRHPFRLAESARKQ
ncbi:MAG: leucine-rich repeat domain-containing protein, partial [Lachnospiraceae bacterium]|nr:leucine-rich repeat domain-containing protein [Lachnospiraceae bacterium]